MSCGFGTIKIHRLQENIRVKLLVYEAPCVSVAGRIGRRISNGCSKEALLPDGFPFSLGPEAFPLIAFVPFPVFLDRIQDRSCDDDQAPGRIIQFFDLVEPLSCVIGSRCSLQWAAGQIESNTRFVCILPA
jgi:hypothetical protein